MPSQDQMEFWVEHGWTKEEEAEIARLMEQPIYDGATKKPTRIEAIQKMQRMKKKSNVQIV